jgi:hypothetical protein
MAPPSEIFTRQDLTQCQRHLDALNDFMNLKDKAAACGVDIEPLVTIRNQLVDQLRAVRDNFMPGA